MLELEQALEKILGVIPASKAERIPLAEAHRRVLAEDVLAAVDLPAFDNSSVDGYAVRAQDIAQAGTRSPVWLSLVGKVAAGESFNGKLSPAQCIRIFTGSRLPDGADAVAMQEDTRLQADRPTEVGFLDVVKPWEHIRFRGEDIKCGAIAVRKGEILRAAQLGLLTASGITHVNAGRRPGIALVATGSELREPGSGKPGPGQIYESNRALLAPLVGEAGGVPVVFPIVADEPGATRESLARALAECDMVVTCGGVSVGEMDFVKSAFEELGGDLQFWKVAIKPGRPFLFGRSGAKFLFGLPGNPVSAFVTFLLLVRPALLRWQGARFTGMPMSTGILGEPLSNSGLRRHFMSVTVDEKGEVRLAGTQASHILSSVARAQGMVDVPPQTNLPAGTSVTVLRWDW